MAAHRYKLTYFPVRARAEPIRIILTLAGADWEDNRNMTDDDLAALNQRMYSMYCNKHNFIIQTIALAVICSLR